MARIGSIDPRFQSYDIEMVEVTGGRFWRPYKAGRDNPSSPSDGAPHGMDPSLYGDRKPIHLTPCAAAQAGGGLGPACVRVSGTWANTTYSMRPGATVSGPTGAMRQHAIPRYG